MPGMIDTHRHMWQTAMRGYGADWTLTQYFVWYYLEHGRKFRPEDIARRQPAVGHRVARRRRHHHGRLVARPADRRPRRGRGRRAAGGARPVRPGLRQHPGRPLGVDRRPGGPRRSWSGSATPATTCSGVQLAFDVTGDPAFPEKAAFEVARELGIPVTTHAGVWGATNDDGIRLMHENGFMTPETVYVHASTLTRDSYQRIAATGGSISVVDRVRVQRRPGLRAHRAGAAVRHPGVAVDGHQRVVERRPVLRDARDARRRPHGRAHGGPPQGRDDHAPAPARRSRSSSGPPAAARTRSAATTSAACSRARRPTSS